LSSSETRIIELNAEVERGQSSLDACREKLERLETPLREAKMTAEAEVKALQDKARSSKDEQEEHVFRRECKRPDPNPNPNPNSRSSFGEKKRLPPRLEAKQHLPPIHVLYTFYF